MLTRDGILAALSAPLDLVTVAVPEWGGSVKVRLLSEAEVESLGSNTKHARSRFAVMACCDDAGKRLFTDDDMKVLSSSPGAFNVLDRIWREGGQFNGLISKEPEKN